MTKTIRSIYIAAGLAALIPDVSRADEDAGAGDLWTRHHLTGDWGGLRGRLEDAGVSPSLQEQSEIWGDLAGGRRRGATYDGLTTASVRLDLDRLWGWRGATFYASAFQIHGRTPSGERVGDLQIVSSIEATRATRLADLWLEQKLWEGKVSIRAGQEGADEEFMTSAYSAAFLNSTFGFPPLTAIDLPSGGPSYPLGTPFARIKYQATETLAFLGGVYNGDPAPAGPGDPQRRDASGTAFRTNDHLLGWSELQYSAGDDILKLGAWYSSTPFPDLRAGYPTHSPGFGVYGVIDHRLWHPAGGGDDAGISAFTRIMAAPGSFNLVDLMVQGGLHWKGPIDGRGDDVAGLAASYVKISPLAAANRGSETAIELTYQYKVADWLAVQPDIQYVVNPGARAVAPLANALVLGTRVTVDF